MEIVIWVHDKYALKVLDILSSIRSEAALSDDQMSLIDRIKSGERLLTFEQNSRFVQISINDRLFIKFNDLVEILS